MIIVNAARGGLVDEAALADALKSGQVGAAGIDVYAKEPTTDSPLFGLPNTVVTPHLGASTTEAQDKAGTAVARSVRLALQGEFVPDAVNVQAGGVVAEDVRPGLPLAEKLGRVFTAVAGGLAQSVNVEVRGKIAEFDVSVVQLAVLKGVFSDVVEEQVTYVNAPLLAEQRGLEVVAGQRRREPRLPQPDHACAARWPTAPQVTVSGTLFGKNQVPKLTEVDGFDIDLDLSGYLLFFVYTDRPGVVGTVGAALGEAGVNIAGAQVSRTTRGGEALMAVTVDSPVPRRAARPTSPAGSVRARPGPPTSTPSDLGFSSHAPGSDRWRRHRSRGGGRGPEGPPARWLPTSRRTAYDLGAMRWQRTGELLPDTVLEELRQHDAILLGADRRPERAAGHPRARAAAAAAVRARPPREPAAGQAVRRRRPARWPTPARSTCSASARAPRVPTSATAACCARTPRRRSPPRSASTPRSASSGWCGTPSSGRWPGRASTSR